MATVDSGVETEAEQASAPLEFYNDSICRQFAFATLAWGLVATGLGIFVALMMVLPSWITGYEELTVGRMRPLHTTLALFAFVGNGIFAAIYYTTQRLCRTRLWSSFLAQVHFWGWQASVLAGAVTLFLGAKQAREFAEMQWPVDAAIAAVWIVFAINFFMTLAKRREERLYISLWFYLASIVVFGIAHTLGNVVIPMGQSFSIPLFAGVQDALTQWWHGHHLITFFLTMPFLGLMYYLVPKLSGRPLYSYPLAIVHFWSLLILSVWAWPRMLHFTPIPESLSSLGMLSGMMLLIPSLAAAINGLKTLRSGKPTDGSSPARGFVYVALICYAVMSSIDALLSIKTLAGSAQFTDLTIGQMHLGTLGWNGMMMFGMLYWISPRLFQTGLRHSGLSKLHFAIATAGILLYVLPIYAAGLMESRSWLSLDQSGQLAHPEFIDSLVSAIPMWWIRVIGGGLYTFGILLIGVQYSMTWFARPSSYSNESVPAGASESTARTKKTEKNKVGKLVDVPVLELAKSIEQATDMSWHIDWEKSATRFGWVVAGILLISTTIQIAPVVLFGDTQADPIESYTPLELVGRQIYLAEGCQNCHSQMVRPMIAETMRYGDFTIAEDTSGDRPTQWGTRRIGPDLACQGGVNTSFWHWNHLRDPRATNAESVMPGFAQLTNRRLDFEKALAFVEQQRERLNAEPLDQEQEIAGMKRQAETIAAEIVGLGGPVMRGDLMTFDTQAIALIAYLQRLGVTPAAKPDEPKETLDDQPTPSTASLNANDGNEANS